MIKEYDAFIEISPFEAERDEHKSIKTFQSAWRDENYTNAYVQI